ncbi:MAG: pilus assembly protein [Hyphomicrobiales bacterium]|nr:pilus assembly protein [Hyphomicrobiales bacterium]MCP5373587.1 pilus assembly protein [Hyphomicrobiales bacterium]
MSRLLSRFLGDRRGNSLLEFAFTLPLMVLLLSGTIEIGNHLRQANTVEKSLNAAALYIARSDNPNDAAVQSRAANLARTGTLDGSGNPLVTGWDSSDSILDISVASHPAGDGDVPVIRLEATVPYVPLVPGLMSFVGITKGIMRLSHEQAYVGN